MMKSTAKSGLKIMLLAFSAMSATAHSVPVLDQLSGNPPFNLFSEFHDSIQEAQTFRVGITGTLVRLDIIGEVYNLGRNDPSFFLDIRGVTNSHPDDSVVLQTVRLPGFVPQREFMPVPLQVPVTEGEMLSFVGYSGNGTFIGITTFPDFSTQSAYQFGRHWTEGTPPFGLEGPGTWYPDGGGFAPMDLAFRTYAEPSTIPEPATIGLAMIGLAAAALCRKTNRRSGKLR